MNEFRPTPNLEFRPTPNLEFFNTKTSFELLPQNRKYVLYILGGWPMDRGENASRATNLEFVGIFLKWPFRHNRGPGQKPKTRIMHFGWLANGP